MNKIIIALLALIAIVVIAGCVEEPEPEITSFEECINAGNPAMESYPRQCMAGDKTFTEESCSKDEFVLTLVDAKEIAVSTECGTANYRKPWLKELKDTYMCNNDTGTWWLDMEPSSEIEGCNPACVVNVVTRKAVINWRCTGALPE